VTDRRWEKAAARENARRDARAPLLAHAGLVPHTTADAQEAKVARVQGELADRLASHAEQSRRKIDVMRADLRALVGDEAIAALDAKRRIYPKGLEYDLDILTGEIAKATGRTNGEVFDAYKPRPRVAEDRVRVADVGHGEDARERDDAAEREADGVDEAGPNRNHLQPRVRQ
jgi:hypothetical protein